ncbi:MAG: LamG-like jellyroll fold domain-containing protein [Verrucomicrobiota bacterium]
MSIRIRLEALTCGLVLGLGAANPGVAATLLAYYPFEEGTGVATADCAGSNGPAALLGDAAFCAEGKYGLCVELNGVGSVVDTGQRIIDTSRSYSLAAWVAVEPGFEDNYMTILSQDDEKVSNFYLLYRSAKSPLAPGTLALTKWSSPSGEPKTDFAVHSVGGPQASHWVHVAGVQDMEQKKLRFYLDGKLVDEQAYDPAGGAYEWASRGHTIIGRGQFGGQPVDFLEGRIDEVYLFQGVLSAEEIERIKEDRYFPRPVPRGTTNPVVGVRQVVLDVRHVGGTISPLLFGHNLEHTRHALWQGLSAELLANRKFAGESTATTGGGAPVTRGRPGADGVAARWHGIGKPQAAFFAETKQPFTGSQSQGVEIGEAGIRGGIGQRRIPVQAGREYELRLCLRTDRQRSVEVRLCSDAGGQVYAAESIKLSGEGWQEWRGKLRASGTDLEARLEITFGGPGRSWLGAASMLPADHFYGIRRDVIEQLKQISVPVLRWPGGNFTADYRWQDGLLPVDKRPPINVINTETLPFTDNYDFHDLGIDEYMKLCREIGAEPSITINLNPAVAPPADAAAWVEYCNGSVETRWGKVRAGRGHVQPYRVKYWSLGNEIWGGWMGPASGDAAGYAKRLSEYAKAMKQADPSILLIACGGGAEWDKTVVAQAGEWFDLVSEHNYAPEGEAHVALPRWREYGRLARFPGSGLRQSLDDARRAILSASPDGKRIGIAFDEWNVWHTWFVQPFTHEWSVNAIDGAYAASALNMLCREAESLGVVTAAYFQPINEGAIAVEPFSAKLTGVGQVFSLFRGHRGNRLIKTSPVGGVDVCASLSPDGKRLYATLVNASAGKTETAELLLQGADTVGEVRTRYLVPAGLEASLFEDRCEEMTAPGSHPLRLALPTGSVVLVEAGLRERASDR